jgi:hypothetical protein
MTDEEAINDDDVDEPLEDEDDESLDGDADGDGDEPSSSSKSKSSEVLEDFSIASRQRIRDELDDQIAAFLAKGGKIMEVPANVSTDPPKKPAPDYGGRPI